VADDALNNRLFFRLLQAGNIYERKAQNALGYSSIQGALLGALSREPAQGIPLSDLVEYLSVSRQNLDGVLKRLEKAGQVERTEDPTNRRVKIVRLTPAGLAAWNALFEKSLTFYRLGTLGIGSEEKAAFAQTLVRILRALRAIEPSAFQDRTP
jgi:DNA-binding MarR family transcriptional regulator